MSVLILNKARGNKNVRSNYRNMSVESSLKVYGKILGGESKDVFKNLLINMQRGLRDRRGCVDQAFMFKTVCEKYLENHTN